MVSAGTDEDVDVALRCRVLTAIYAGGNSRAFAESIGVSPTRWNNVESSGALSRDLARMVYRRYPEVSLDWLYRGTDQGLTAVKSNELAKAYLSLARVPAAGTARKRGSAH